MRIVGLSLPLVVLLACSDKGDPDFPGGGSGTDTGDSGPVDLDEDGVAADEDCDDSDPSAYPGAEEVCDGVDNDCDGEVDNDASDAVDWYADADEDGFGDAEADATTSCEAPSGSVDNADDCDDYDDAVSPDADEICDGLDNDCNGLTDAADPGIDLKTATEWFRDSDEDGYGDAADTMLSCDQPTGYVLDGTDCDDTLDAANPGEAEVCDDIDNDCDKDIDEGDATDAVTWYADADSDSYGDPAVSTDACDQPSGYVRDDTDCDDTAAGVNPAAAEVCNDIDDDCDSSIDDADKSLDASVGGTTYYTDSDGDGYGDPASSAMTCDLLAGYADNDGDCDDTDSAISPDADEVCDGDDNDCDGAIDDDDSSVDTATGSTFYADGDGDGYGDPAAGTAACDQPSGYVSDDTDCDDTDGDVNPAAAEVCDDIDNDCDGDTDDTDSDVSDPSTFYRDFDGDGYGTTDYTVEACEQPSNYVSDDTDCDDSDSAISPGASEVCDGDDNDCDGDIDDDDSSIDASTQTPFYDDGDGDGYGDPDATTLACAQPSGTVTNNADCDDTDSAISPDAPEVCDTVDNDCDGDTDDDDSDVDLSTGQTFFADSDGDGYGEPTDTTVSCEAPSGYVSDDTDCDDADGNVNPAAAEVCDGADNDCNGDTDDADPGLDTSTGSTFYRDFDNDTFGDSASSTMACEEPAGYTSDDTDCDDASGSINPDAPEVCDTVDNDCDGAIDDDDSSVDTATGSTFYADGDGDGYGDPAVSTAACEEPSGYVSDDTDCDDTDGDVNPAAAEVCDSIDNDCDGDVDADDSELSECFSGLEVADLIEGDLILTEIMPNPDAVSDSNGEWFEIYNASGDAVELEDLVITDNVRSHTVSGSLQIDADSYVVFCVDSNTATNGGQDCDYDYPSTIALGNSGDQITLSYDGTTFDEVSYAGWTVTAGASLALSTLGECADVDSNDLEGLWCTESTDTYGDGDYGSPGGENSGDCLVSTDYGYVPSSSSAYNSVGDGLSLAYEVTIGSDGYLSAFEANSAFTGFGEAKLALYTDDGGEPGDLIAYSETVTESTGNFTLDVDTSASGDTCPAVIEAGTYWIVAKAQRLSGGSGFGWLTKTNGSFDQYYTTESFSADFPDPYNGTYFAASYRMHIGVTMDEQ